MADRTLSFQEIDGLLSKQMLAVDTGRANLDNATAQANLAGKLLKSMALQLACTMFQKTGGKLSNRIESAMAEKLISS